MVHVTTLTPGSDDLNGGGVKGAPRYSISKKPDPFVKTGRSKYLCWDDYFMSLAFLSAQRSKDPNKQVVGLVAASMVHVANLIPGSDNPSRAYDKTRFS
jgi:hypothetical protein